MNLDIASVLRKIIFKDDVHLVAQIVDAKGDILSEKIIVPPFHYPRNIYDSRNEFKVAIFSVLVYNEYLNGNHDCYTPGRSETMIKLSFPIPDEEIGNADRIQFHWDISK